jgi:hypothetical protein
MNFNGHRLSTDMLSSFTQEVWCEARKEDDPVERGEGSRMWKFSPVGREYIPGDGDGEYVRCVKHPHAFPNSPLIASSKLTSRCFNPSSVPSIKMPTSPLSSNMPNDRRKGTYDKPHFSLWLVSLVTQIETR